MKKHLSKIITFIIVLTLAISFVGFAGRAETPSVKMIDIKLTNEEYAYVCKKGNMAFVSSMNAFLDEIKKNGTFDMLVSKYFEGEGEKIGYPVSTDAIANTENNFVVATNCPFEPFEYMGKDGLIYGLDVEIAAAYAEANGLELVIKNVDFDAIFTQVDAGYADIGMAGITISEDRAKIYDFTNPYYEASQKLIVPFENTDFDNCKNAEDVNAVLASLEGELVGYQNATTASLYIQGNEDWGFDGFSNISGKSYATAQIAIVDLMNKNLYAVMLDEAPAVAIIGAMNNASWADKFSNFFETLGSEHYRQVFFKGLGNTIGVAVVGLLIGILIGIVIAIVKVAPKYKLINQILDNICSVYVAIFRGTPIVAQLLIAYYVLIPMLKINVDSLTVGMIVFGMNSGAYVAEIMRGGLNSVDRGQMEAGRALGLTYTSTMLQIVVPQAVKNILPTLGNEFISLIKETSVLSFIAVYDLYKATLDVGMVNYDSMVPYLMMGLVYIVLVLVISACVKLIERRFAKSDRN